MALKNIKITRQLVQNCNKLLAGHSDVASLSSSAVTDFTENGAPEKSNIRYRLAAPIKAPLRNNILPQQNMQEYATELKHLQPSLLPKYIEVDLNSKSDPMGLSHQDREFPKPELIKELNAKNISATTSHELKQHNLRSKYNFITRNHSTSPFLVVSRNYSSKKAGKDCGGQKKEKKEPCDHKPRCVKNKACPNFVVGNCDMAPPSDCTHYYTEVCCKKKMAPYPSYSETCHDILEDSPSECFQCPWQKCGGVDAIRPPKRKYHTSTRHEIVGVIPELNLGAVPNGLFKSCDASKGNCPRPPDRCPPKEKPKCPEKKKEKKKKCDSKWKTAYGFWAAKDNVITTQSWNTVNLELLKGTDDTDAGISAAGCTKMPFDERLADYEHLKKRKCVDEKDPKCQKRKKKVIDDCPHGKCKPGCVDHMVDQVLMHLKDPKDPSCPHDKPPCPPKFNIQCPKVDLEMNILAKEHDKGHPLPCPGYRKPSKACPNPEKKKPFKDQRDLDGPVYRRTPKPYTDPDDKEI